jgi:uncharacterized membrane protein
MVKSHFLRVLLCLAYLFTFVGGILASQAAVNAADTPTPTPAPTATPSTVSLQSKYPVLSNDSGQVYSFDVDIKYSGPDRKTFDLTTTAPQGWLAFCSAGYPEKQVSAVQIGPADPASPVTESIKVNLLPNMGKTTDLGTYNISLKVSSGTLSQTLDLKAIVNAKYAMSVATESGNLTTQATAGKENHTSIELVNSGSAAITNISFTSTKPEGWIVSFKPDKIDSLASGQTQQIDVVINPPDGKTIAGDYLINLKADNASISANMDLRVTVVTSSIWGWVGIIIVVLVIAGFAVVFMKLGRR